MKLGKPVLFLILLLLGTFEKGISQEQPILGKFLIVKVGNDVYLNWTINAGSICSGIQIERSVDSVEFVTIGNISGTCGSISEAISYDFTDEEPIRNKRNYYRLIFGGTQVSNVISIEIIDIEILGYQIRPHPLVENSLLYFENSRKIVHQVEFYNSNGNIVQRLTTKTDNFEIQRSLFSAGMYYFIISNSFNSSILKGKLLVQ